MVKTKPTKAAAKFIDLLEKAMNEHLDNLSLRQVAKRADISPAYLSLLLSGERDAPSNDAIARLESVLNIPEGELFKAAGRPNDEALEFFRKDEAGPIMRSLARVPDHKLLEVQKLISRFLKNRI